MIHPSCPALIIHDDNAFRRDLIKTLDQNHFTVSFASDGDGALGLLSQPQRFRVIIVAINLKTQNGIRALEHLRDHRDEIRASIIILGEPDPQIRTLAPWADETLLKPVSPEYVAQRARTYCAA